MGHKLITTVTIINPPFLKTPFAATTLPWPWHRPTSSYMLDSKPEMGSYGVRA